MKLNLKAKLTLKCVVELEVLLFEIYFLVFDPFEIYFFFKLYNIEIYISILHGINTLVIHTHCTHQKIRYKYSFKNTRVNLNVEQKMQ